MNEFFLYEAINEIDDKLITAANIKTVPHKRKNKLLWTSVAAVMVIAISAVAIKNSGFKIPDVRELTTVGKGGMSENQNSFLNTKEIKMFKNTSSSPDLDDYGEDGLPYVDLIIDGIIYHQIDISNYNSYGLKTKLSESDFGDCIGTVKELTAENGYNNSLFKVSSHENSLNNAQAYYYAPTKCKATVIVESGQNCAVFLADDFTDDNGENYYKKMFELYNVKNASDIKSISYEIWKGDYDSTNTAIITRSAVNTPKEIESVYEILVSDEKSENQEIINKKSYNIAISLNLINGLIIGNSDYKINYVPYNSTGYIHNKGVITTEQNEILKQIFNVE